MGLPWAPPTALANVCSCQSRVLGGDGEIERPALLLSLEQQPQGSVREWQKWKLKEKVARSSPKEQVMERQRATRVWWPMLTRRSSASTSTKA